MKNLRRLLALAALTLSAPAVRAQDVGLGLTISQNPTFVFAFEATRYIEIQATAGVAWVKVFDGENTVNSSLGAGVTFTLPRGSSGFQFRPIGVASALIVASANNGTSVGVNVNAPFAGLGFLKNGVELIVSPQFDFQYVGGTTLAIRLMTGQIRDRF